MRSYRPQELFDADGRLRREIAALAPQGDRRMSANPHANGGLLRRDLMMPDFADYAVGVAQPGRVDGEATRVMGDFLRDMMKQNEAAISACSARTRPPPTGCQAVFEVTERAWMARDPARRRSSVARRPGHGDPERAHLPGLARRLSADRAARPVLLLRGVHPHRQFDVQPARQVAEEFARDPVAAADLLAELSADIACLAAGPQRLQPPGPGLHRSRREQEGRHHARLSAARCQHACSG